jgi:LDH2 family malate/lactate/ureidoglycolate dehydrogenase
MPSVRIDELRRCLTEAFERLGVADADGLAGLLVDSELRGHHDHGVAALGLLSELYGDGRLNPRPQVKVLRETEGALLLDGDRGCGPAAPSRAMAWCIERARSRGAMAVASIRDWQLIVGAPWVRQAAEAGLIGYACTNFIPLVAPPGGRTPVLGTNPFAYGLPSRRRPVVLDVATTVVAMQKVRVAAQEGVPMPEGTIFDSAGRPTTDPAAFVSLAPLGSPLAPHKGFGLALFIEVLSGLSGADAAAGSFLWALDPEAFLPRAEFLEQVDALIDRVKESGPEVVAPGERGERRHRELTERGVLPLTPAGWDTLAERCRALGVEPPSVEDAA